MKTTVFLLFSLIFSSRFSAGSGRAVFSKHCWFCHGQKGDGNSDAAAVLNPKPKNFTDPEVIRNLTFDRMVDSIMNGRPNTAMPSFKKRLSINEIISVAKYIRDVIMKGIPTDKIYEPHTEGFSYIDFKKIDKNSDLKICLLHCHSDETFIRKRIKELRH